MAERSGELEKKEIDNDLENRTDETEDETVKSADEISDDPDEIREQIEETRRDLGETIDAIQEKLSISNITEQVKEQVTEQISGAVETLKTTVSESPIGKAGKFMKSLGQELKKSNITKIASENPLPLLLVGVGVGLLAYTGYSRKSSSRYEKRRYKGNLPKAETHRTKQSESGGRSIVDKASGLYESVGDSAGAAYQSVTNAAGDAYDKIGDYSGQLRGQYNHQLQENPLLVGAIALAVGAAVGLAIPSTEYEGELMGEARENLMSKAEDAARGAFDKVQQVVEQAKDTIAEEVKSQTSAQ